MISKNTEYKKISQELNFKLNKFLRFSDEEGLYIAVGEIDGRKVCLKIIPLKLSGRVEWIKKDVQVSQLLSKKTNLDFNVLKFIKEGQTEKSYWFLREYVEYNSLANYEEDGFLHGYDIVEQEFLNDDVVNKVITILQQFREIEVNNVKLSDYKRFPVKISDKLSIVEDAMKIDLRNVEDFFDRNLVMYLSDEKTPTAMGDFSPSNLLIERDQFYIFDFEHFGRDNYMIDTAYFWLFIWRYKEWQELLIKALVKNETDQKCFNLSVIRIIIHVYSSYLTIADAELRKKMLASMQNFIWKKYLLAAGISFEELIRVDV